ncbi:MAG: DUF6599 family protein [Candidatus Latescibacterota bacterium]
MFLRYMIILIFLLSISLPTTVQTTVTFDLDGFKIETAKFIPSNREIEGFSLVSGPAYYGPHNLWDYIDGGALPYRDYGVLGAATFTGTLSPDSLRITVDLYRMPDDLCAFGIYSSERDREARFLPIGAEGCLSGPALFFWKGAWYVKVVTVKESERSKAAVEHLARWIEKRIPGEAEPPALLALFPPEGKTPRSEQYLAKDVLGQDFLKKALAVEYTLDGSPCRIFLINSGSPDQAGKDFQGCREYIKESGGVSDRVIRSGDEAFAGTESFYGQVCFIRKGKWVLASVGLQDLGLAVKILDGMMGRLPEKR